MNILEKFIPPKDKLKHAYIGSLIYAVLTIFISPPMAFLIVFLVAAVKEVIIDDKMKKGTPEFMDAVFTIMIPALLLIGWFFRI